MEKELEMQYLLNLAKEAEELALKAYESNSYVSGLLWRVQDIRKILEILAKGE